MDINDINELLLEVGFIKKSERGEPYYEFYQEYPTNSDLRSNLYVSFEDYNNIFYIHFNCLNIHSDKDINKIKSNNDFLKELDSIVLSGKDGWIYSDRHYYNWWKPADEQRKRYFDNRMKMKIKPCKEILDYISKYGLGHSKSYLEIKYKGKNIAEMSWEELADALIKETKK